MLMEKGATWGYTRSGSLPETMLSRRFTLRQFCATI